MLRSWRGESRLGLSIVRNNAKFGCVDLIEREAGVPLTLRNSGSLSFPEVIFDPDYFYKSCMKIYWYIVDNNWNSFRCMTIC